MKTFARPHDFPKLRSAILSRALICGLVALALAPLGLRAVEATTVPVGVITFDIPAGSLSAPSTTTFSIPLRGSVESSFVGAPAGRLTGVTSTTLSNSAAGWQGGQLSVPAAPYFVRLTSGAAKGRTLQISTTTANTATVLTVDNQGTDLSTLGIVTGANGDTYEIFPGDTLVLFFGDQVLAGPNQESADNIQIFDGSVWRVFFRNSSTNQWQRGNFAVNQNDFVLRPDNGIIFRRRGGTALKFQITGTVPNTDIRAVVKNSGPTFLGGVFPTDSTLGALNFNQMPGWVSLTANNTVGDTDKLNIWDGNVWVNYYYDTTLVPTPGWRRGSFQNNLNGVVVPAGRPFWIQKAGATAGTATYTLPLPYTL